MRTSRSWSPNAWCRLTPGGADLPGRSSRQGPRSTKSDYPDWPVQSPLPGRLSTRKDGTMASELQERKFWDGYSALVKRAWQDDAFKQRLLSDPVAVFNENNLTVPDGVQVKILEDTDQVRHLPLPPKPTVQEAVPRAQQPAATL